MADENLILTIGLVEPISDTDIADARIGDFRNGTPLGVDFKPRFAGRREDGMVDVSVFDSGVNPEIFARNGPPFIGQDVTIAK